MKGHLPNLASMRDPDFMELVWENGQILIRRLSSKITKKSSPSPFSSGYFSQSSGARIGLEGGTSAVNGSKDGVADSTLADPLSGLSSLTKLDRHHDKNKIKSPQTGYPELLSGLYEDGFNVVLGSDKKCNDKQLIDSNIVVPVNKFNKNFNQSYVSKLVEEIPQRTMNGDSKVPPRSSLEQHETSIQFMGSKEKKLRIDEESDRLNFSIFLKSPQARSKANHPSSGGTRAMSGPGLAAGAEDLEGNVVRSGPRSSDPFVNEGNFTARKMKPILPDSEPQKESVPDEQSEAVPNTRSPDQVHGPSSSLASNHTDFKGNPGNGKSVEQMVASSICSHGASNCPTYTLKRRYEDTDLSENSAMEEPEGTTTKAAPAARKSKDAKRKRKTEVRNLSEKRRRDKINKKMRALKKLIPNCNKVDKASMLDEAIEYLKTLQLQVQMMTMRTRVYMPPTMLPSPSARQHINAQHLGGYSPMAVGMDMMRMQMGLGCGPAQFPASLESGAAALPGITAARLNMFGVPADQVLLSFVPHSPFVSSTCSFSPQPVQGPGAEVSQVAAVAAAQVDLPRAANALSTSKGSNPTH